MMMWIDSFTQTLINLINIVRQLVKTDMTDIIEETGLVANHDIPIEEIAREEILDTEM